VKILFCGDVVGEPGRNVLAELLPGFIQREGVDFCIVNAENAAGGAGLSF
jgi:calcineurin-like phosphoesterase